MGDEKIGIRRLEHYDLHGRVCFEVGDERSQFDDRCGNKHVDRRVIEGDRPPARVAAVGVKLRICSLTASLCSAGLGHHLLLSCEGPHRSELKPARSSSEKSFGCSQAAKCPPLGSLLK